MNDELSTVNARLLARNIINMRGEVDSQMAVYVRDAIADLVSRGAPPCRLLISSNGGSVEAGLHIYDMIACYPSAVEGTVIGFARSMAAIVLQGCTKRLCLPHGRILIHHINRKQISLDVLRDEKRYRETLQDMERDQEQLYGVLSKRTKKSAEEIRIACERNEDMTAEDAKTFGLIDEIAPYRTDKSIEPA